MNIMITLNVVDYVVIILYGLILVWMGFYFKGRSNTSEGFMVASRGIPAWAAGLAIMSAYTSSISYVATPGKAFSSDWHPMIFACPPSALRHRQGDDHGRTPLPDLV